MAKDLTDFIEKDLTISVVIDLQNWLESRVDIIPRPSLLDPYMPLSVHTAPDVLGSRLVHV